VVRGDQARQISTVLRLEPGSEIVLVANSVDTRVRLDRVTRDEVAGTVVSRARNTAEPALALTLALPLLRGDHSEEVLEAVTQLGVVRVVPFVSERSVARDLSRTKRDRWGRIAREAAETARRGRIPEIGPVAHWSDLFDALEPPVIVAWEGERERSIADAPRTGSLSLVIGPEGGLTDAEVELARGRGASIVSLGARNLRSETAAIAAVAAVLIR
jgi:16S rRNA (uracil1498-N3)-methyltransferase